MRSNNKGNIILEVFSIMLVAVILIIGVLAFISANDELSDEILEDPFIDEHNESKAIVTASQNRAPKAFDYIPLTVFLVLGLAAAISAWFTKTHPVFLFIALLPFVVLIIAGWYLNQALDDVKNDYADMQADLPLTFWLVDNFVVLLTFTGLLISLTAFLGWRGSS